jgi:fluoride exporter
MNSAAAAALPIGLLMVVLFASVAATATVVRALAGGANRPGSLPWGTLAVNVGGSFAAGLAAGWLGGLGGGPAAVLVGVAGLGSLTTFSGFARELADAGTSRQWLLATANLGLCVIGGVVAAFAGLALTG